MNIVRIFKIGDFYKVISVPVREHEHNKSRSEHKFKFLNNIIRAKTNISNLILNNNLPYFFTQTLNNNHNRQDFKYLRKSITNKIRKLRQELGLDLQYIFILEKHKDNINWHLHRFIKS